MPHVTLAGDLTGEYLVSERRAYGTLLLSPDRSAEAIRRRADGRWLTPAEQGAFFAEYGEHMLPPDGEG